MEINSFLAAALGGGLFVFVQFLITRHDNKKGYIEELRTAIAQLRKEAEEERMIVRRRNIFRFSQEVRTGVRHTEEEWNQLNEDISDYIGYCRNNPGFVNSRCDTAIDNLKEVYKKVLGSNDFA